MSNVPFNIPIPGGIHPGTMVKIRGATPPGAQRMDVMLVSGATNTSDVPLHLWFNLQDQSLHLNNVTGGNTPGQPQQTRTPLQAGQPFEVAMLCEQPGFRVAVNGTQVAQFRHRLPFQNITNLAATGQMQVQNISFETLSQGPPVPPQGMPPQGVPMQVTSPQGMPPQGMPPQGMPPQGMPPQGMPQQGMPPQRPPPQGMPAQQQGYPPQQPPPQQPQQSGRAGMLGGTLGGAAAGAVAGGLTSVIASKMAGGGGGGGGGGGQSSHDAGGTTDTGHHDTNSVAAASATPQQAHTDQGLSQSDPNAGWDQNQQGWGQTDQTWGQTDQGWGQTDQGWGQTDQQQYWDQTDQQAGYEQADQDEGWGGDEVGQYDQDPGYDDGGDDD